ncbi:MAG: 30S ribosome-binding factor RbfA [Victivallales bacterium]|nr:30S ribosome-binding factor RbfA [Victivallales bacterium]
MSGAPDRLTRVNELLKREIADYLERNPYIKDGGGLISVTGVNIGSNLRTATVKVSVLGSAEDQRSALSRLAACRSDIQKRVARDVTLKYTPVLKFVLDATIERGDNVLDIIREMEHDAEHNH